MKNKYKGLENNRSMYVTIIILILIGVFLMAGTLVVRKNLMENTHEYGQTLVKNYAAEEELNIASIRRQLDLGIFGVADLKKTNPTQAETAAWFKQFNNKLAYVMGERVFDFYGVVDAVPYSATAEQGQDLSYFFDRKWYKKAMLADGNTIYTGIYRDFTTGKDVTTIARKLPHSNDVVAIDMVVEKGTFKNNVADFVDTASFYVFDRNDKLFYYKTEWGLSSNVANKYGKVVMDHIHEHGDDPEYSIIMDQMHVKYGIYHTEMENGGTVVMIVPIKDIMEGKKNVILGNFIIGAIVLFIIVAALLYRTTKQRKNITASETTIGLLGDMYYAIYKIDFTKETYECIKTTPDLKEILGKKGEYSKLVKVLQEISWPRTNDDYIERFKLDKLDKASKKKKGTYSYYGGEFMRKFGDEYKWVNVRIIQDGKLAMGESIWCFREVDEEKKKELENTKMLKDMLADAEKKDKNKSEFFSKMSHDMRTPLNAIIGFSDLSQSHSTDSACLMEYMGKIGLSARQLLSLINDILEYSSMGEEIKKLKVEPFKIDQVVDDVKMSFEERIKKTGKTISTDVDVVHNNVLGDSFKLVQVLNNLISNSIKYSNEGDSVKVCVKEVDTGHFAKYQIIIEDTGIGMSPEFLEHIYEPYAREVQLLSKSEVMGTGLGMLIVKNLIGIMNGEINVESTQGVGTKITLTLPFEVINEEDMEDEGKSLVKPEDDSEFLEGKKILVAEDNELNMEILYEMLKMRGVEVTKAWNGQEAVDIFADSEEGYFDCILMDMHMPVMEGCEAAEHIRAMDRSDAKTVMILAVTANAFAEDISKTTASGMNGHVPKPLDFNVLYKFFKK